MPSGEYALLLTGVFACSTAVLMIKTSHSHPLVLSGVRSLIAGLALMPIMMFELLGAVRRQRSLQPLEAISPRKVVWSLPGAVLLAVHFMTWTIGARMTDAANATLIVNLNPVALPFLMALVNRERINRGEILGTLIAMAGVLGLMGQSYRIGASTVWGDLVCFGSMLLFCLYIAFGRVAGRGRSLWVYLVPLYLMTGVICLTTAVIATVPWPDVTTREVLSLVGLGLIPTVIGHSILNHSIRVLRGQTVSTVNLSQTVFAAIMAYFLFGERPAERLFVAALVMLVGVIVVIRSGLKSPAIPEE